MRSLRVTQENLDNQRNAVQEEKRLRYDNQPYVNAFLRINELIFKNPANAHSTIGSMEDLDAATIDDVKEFFRIYYAPNNAVLAIVGDFETAEATGLVRKYFEGIPSQPPPPPVDVSEPDDVAQSQEVYKDKLAPAPAFVLGWKIPPRRTPDFYALSLAADLIFEGDSSRLYQKLVKGKESVVSIQGGIDERRGPSALYIFALPKPGEEVATIRNQIFDEIRSLGTSGPSAAEMEKLQNGLCNDLVRGRQSTMYRAQRLAEYAIYDGDPTLFDTDLDHYLAITPEQIRSAVERYIDIDNRVVLDIVPAALAEDTTPAETIEVAPSASAQVPGEPTQPTAPPPQISPPPPVQQPATDAGAVLGASVGNQLDQSQQPSEAPKQTERGSGPLHT
jgi:predicted Zn-dependent peptidase